MALVEKKQGVLWKTFFVICTAHKTGSSCWLVMMSQEVMVPDGNGHSDEGWIMENRNTMLAAWAFEDRLSSVCCIAFEHGC